ncbi:hypothetical protein SAMD00023353_4900490 [Rosellinia necatrix]|uniref:Uncharacterized protein n=1 Tax=Rosellinia necatrix TaxID=77044 RepID=A0A1W2TPQ0_ROSNE|nr:hypothetical protein SAMD00023353_4900490 [Rosellinia necatrix]
MEPRSSDPCVDKTRCGPEASPSSLGRRHSLDGLTVVGVSDSEVNKEQRQRGTAKKHGKWQWLRHWVVGKKTDAPDRPEKDAYVPTHAASDFATNSLPCWHGEQVNSGDGDRGSGENKRRKKQSGATVEDGEEETATERAAFAALGGTGDSSKKQSLDPPPRRKQDKRAVVADCLSDLQLLLRRAVGGSDPARRDHTRDALLPGAAPMAEGGSRFAKITWGGRDDHNRGGRSTTADGTRRWRDGDFDHWGGGRVLDISLGAPAAASQQPRGSVELARRPRQRRRRRRRKQPWQKGKVSIRRHRPLVEADGAYGKWLGLGRLVTSYIKL